MIFGYMSITHKYIKEIPDSLYRHVPPCYPLWRLKSCTFGKPDICRYQTLVSMLNTSRQIFTAQYAASAWITSWRDECADNANSMRCCLLNKFYAVPMKAEGTLFCPPWMTTMAAESGISIIYLWYDYTYKVKLAGQINRIFLTNLKIMIIWFVHFAFIAIHWGKFII